ncbi:AarF/UbiB family protein [Gracilibacillus sp. S3-1-1]|uniref:AarF/UbiB family protein n=1 Tax=Gracilibacillus pellucidus TaxID=3095368 RepID=A0ACC6M173_9BACI|nr:AarF/UbiB family protein [Gracilibacillus sp. S3-1-1]MDX8044627.1 AarF/UbiB family protein [Gracilibacillus sp. S3-1-1]
MIDNKIGNIDDIYESFDMQPIVAASIGQVHLATLKLTGEKVVVKILRPNVKQKMTVDLDLLIQFVSWLSEMIGIFHADPHPGNIMLTIDGEVALIDFGSVGYLSDDERDRMLRFLVIYSNNDTK